MNSADNPTRTSNVRSGVVVRSGLAPKPDLEVGGLNLKSLNLKS